MWTLLLSLALSWAAPEPGSCPGCRVAEENGWRLEDGALIGPEGDRLRFEVEMVSAQSLSQRDVRGEVARLKKDLAARGLSAIRPRARIVTTALGEPTVLLEYGLVGPAERRALPLTPHDAFEVPTVPSQGLRIVRRCGPTVRVSLEDDLPDPARITQAASQILWADPGCEAFNPQPFHRADPTPEQLAPTPVPAHVVLPEVPEEGSGYKTLFVLIALAAMAGGALTLRKPEPPPPRPPALPPVPVAGVNPAAEVSAAPAAGGLKLGASDGPRATDLMEAALEALARGMGLDRSGLRRPGATAVPASYAAFIERMDGGSWGRGWLRLLGTRPGETLSVADLNLALDGRLGKRVAIGYTGLGRIVALAPDGSVLGCTPDGARAELLAPGLLAWLRALADKAEAREALCDPELFATMSALAGGLNPDEVIDASTDPPSVKGLRELWAEAPPVPE